MKKGYIFCIVSAILFGMAGIFVKLAYKTGLSSIDLLTVQYVLAVFILFALSFIKDKKKLKVTKYELTNLAILGIVGNTFMTIFYYKAFEYLPVSMVTFLLFTYPVMVFLYSSIFSKQKIGKKKFLALFLAFLGCILTLNVLSGGFKYSIKGLIYGLLAAVFYAFMNIFSEKKLLEVDSLSINTYSTFFSLLSLLVYKWPSFLFQGKLGINSLVYIFLLAFVCEILPLTLLYASIKYIGSLKVSIISNLEIPTAMIVSLLVLKEPIYGIQIIGAALIIYSIYLIRK